MSSELRGLRGIPTCLLILAAAGCFQEQLAEQDVSGTVVLPASSGLTPQTAGMIYVGIFEGYDPHALGMPYPTTGPRVGDQPYGDALPYGGTSVGAYTFACFHALACQVQSGRFLDIDDFLAHNEVQIDGEPVTNEQFFDHCSWYFGWNSLEEFLFLGEDRLDFTAEDDGSWSAPFTVLHSQLPEGARIWGFMDNDGTSCTTETGLANRRQSEDGQYWREGSNYNDVLNYPAKYITEGDWLVSEPAVIEADVHDGYSIAFDWEVVP